MDEVANAAFWFGLIGALSRKVDDIRHVMEFEDAVSNFTAAARTGLGAELNWLEGKTLPAGELICKELLPLARSWIAPPALEVASAGFAAEGYDRNQRAYVLRREGGEGALELTLAASDASPLVNPAFVLLGWGEAGAVVARDGRPLTNGREARTGTIRLSIGREAIYVWATIRSER